MTMELEATEEMIEAGACVVAQHDHSCDSAKITAALVWDAMVKAMEVQLPEAGTGRTDVIPLTVGEIENGWAALEAHSTPPYVGT